MRLAAVTLDLETISGRVQTNQSFRAPIFYDSDNTGYYVDPNGTSNVLHMTIDGLLLQDSTNRSGLLSVDRKGTSDWTGYSIAHSGTSHWSLMGQEGVFGAYDDANNEWIWQYIENGRLELRYNGATQGETANGYFLANNQMRAPIFYDSANTAYYVDPASTSVFNAIQADVVDSSNAADPLELCYTTGPEVRIGAGGGTKPIVAGTYARPSADTGYLDGRYGSASSNSTVNPIYCISTSYAPTSSTALGSMYGIGYADGASSGVWSGGGWGMYAVANGTVRHFLDGSNGIGYATGSYRAPIFYDSNNTAYYLDPASNSYLDHIYANNYVNRQSVSDDSGFGLYFNSDKSTAYAIYRESGAWSYPYPDLRIGFHTGIKIGANASYEGIRFYTDYDMVTQVMSVNNSGDGLGASNVYVNNSLQAGSSLRAPIFYDSNNTGYYVDPASTTVLNTVQVGYFTSLSDVRGTIFRDYNDTSYYVDPASTSVCSTVQSIEFQNAAGDGRGHRFWASDSYKIYMSSTGNGTWGGRVAGETTSDYNMYFRMTGGTNRGFVFRAGASGTTNVAGIDASGNGYFTGSITATGNVTAYSDIRVKDNVEQIGGALERLQAIRGVTYTRNDLDDKERRYAGVIAQEIEEVLPEAVFDNGDRKAVDYNATIGLLIEAIKELKAEVETLKKG